MEIWFYTENYLRFTSDNYDPNKLHNKFSNLTNATINKENVKLDIFDENQFASSLNLGAEEDDKAFKIDGNMWFSK